MDNISILSRLLPWTSPKHDEAQDDLQRLATQDAYHLAMKMATEILEAEAQAQLITYMYVPDPRPWLQNCLVIGRATVITGMPDSGKTNLFFVMAESAIEQDWAVGINIESPDPRIHFFQNSEGLRRFLSIPKPKLLGFDDAAIYVSSRRSSSKPAEYFRSLHVAARKPFPSNPEIPGAHLVWLTQTPKIINIDFRERFTAWQLHKPTVELVDAAKIAHRKGKVPLELKKIIWAYFLVKDKDGKVFKRLIWWSAATLNDPEKGGCPKSLIEYDTKDLGEFYMDATPDQIPHAGGTMPEVPPEALRSESGEAFQEYSIRRTIDHPKLGERYAKILQWTYEGRVQEWMAEQIYGSVRRRSDISILLKRVRERYIGYFFEDWWRSQHGLPLVPDDVKNTPIPDAQYEGTYYSLKCFFDRRNARTLYPERDCAPELTAARAEGHDHIMFIVCNPFLNDIQEVKLDSKKTPERYRIHYRDRRDHPND